MNNEIIKEGDWVEYVGRPNEKIQANSHSNKTYPLRISFGNGIFMCFNEYGFNHESDTFPLFKKTTPPKKKVLKEFEVNLYNADPHLYIQNKDLIKIVNDLNITKAKLIIETEE